MKPRVLIIRTAGTNCEKETEHAFTRAGATAILRHINFLKKNPRLFDYQIVCIPGGFSYGDDLGAGKIFALEFLLWFRDALLRFHEKGGLMLGICNGFQVLVKAGILPDMRLRETVTLTDNVSGRFEDRWTYLECPSDPLAPARKIWLKGMPEIVQFPVAHAEGRFYTDGKTLEGLEKAGQVALRYTAPDGAPAGFPFNPNGSLHDVAGITDKEGRIFGLMPHPERCMFTHHYPFSEGQGTIPWGLRVFENAVRYCSKG